MTAKKTSKKSSPSSTKKTTKQQDTSAAATPDTDETSATQTTSNKHDKNGKDFKEKSLWIQFKDDITDLPIELQNLLAKGFDKTYISEEDILACVDDIDQQIEVIEKFYDLCDRLDIKIDTIEETLLRESEDEGTKL